MDSLSIRAILILAGAFLLTFAVFAWFGLPVAEGSERARSVDPFLLTLLSTNYTLTSLAAIVFARGVLGLFVDFSRPVAFFRALAGITDPFMALFGPITPGFLQEAFRPFYAAICLYFIKVFIVFFLFGGFGIPSPLLLLSIALS